MSWLRIDDGFTANGKIAQLTDNEFRCWVRLLCYCAKVKDPTVDKATIQEVSGLSSRRVERLFGLQLLDKIGETYEVHDWAKFLPKDETSAERQARWRARKRRSDAESTVTPPVTPPVTDNGAETVTEASASRERARARDPVPVPLTGSSTVSDYPHLPVVPEPVGGEKEEGETDEPLCVYCDHGDPCPVHDASSLLKEIPW